MKKLLYALLLVASLAGAAFADEKIDGVWGMSFGMSPDMADSIMTEKNRAERVSLYTYLPNYSEAFYRVNFFGREGCLLLRFSKKGLFLARFAFVRRESPRRTPPPEPERPNVIDARMPGRRPAPAQEPKAAPFSSNFMQLKSMLTKKYGPQAQEYKVGEAACGAQWTSGAFNAQTVTLYEDRMAPGSATVLTYEDTGRR